MIFPFEVPADLTALSADEFSAFRTQVTEFARTTLADDAATPETIVATQELFSAVTTEGTRRTELATAATAAREQLAAGLAPVETAPATAPTEPKPFPDEPPVAPAPAAPAVVASTIDTPPAVEPETFAVMTASADASGGGGELASFSAAGALIEKRLASYGSGPKAGNRAARRAAGKGRFVMHEGRSLRRDGNVAFTRTFPEDLRITDGKDAMAVLEHARNERRLAGGSLVASTDERIKSGRSLTAAAGWCAPSETIYDLCALETLDGILPLPEVQATRGGFFIPENGGPNFATIFDAVGDEGDVILTEYDVENGAEKVCIEIPCPDFVEVRMDVAYICLTGSLLQRRGYPEAVTRFSQGAMIALAHKVNASVISRMVALSGSVIAISEPASSDDAASNLISAVELAIWDMRYRNRMAMNATVEVVFPAWVVGPIRASMARRNGVAEMAITDAQILDWFRIRGAVPHFVYDWQDAFAGGLAVGSGMGSQTPQTAFPTSVQFLVYPAGTWLKPVRDVVNLDTVYDNAMLTQNQFTALFAEDGFNVMKMCADSRLYSADVQPLGIAGCCP